ncbi:hypothetical protein E4U57_005845 [Claviceps arundinis]|uniref:Uncharacterized protein n=1 Tax=Claviceps arundinis TaxID=1623583 RepID=A0ABQ7PJ90_9HYPO|nr:hypothetical protein E4U57_005845 [Claviceps arundinis]
MTDRGASSLVMYMNSEPGYLIHCYLWDSRLDVNRYTKVHVRGGSNTRTNVNPGIRIDLGASAAQLDR